MQKDKNNISLMMGIDYTLNGFLYLIKRTETINKESNNTIDSYIDIFF